MSLTDEIKTFLDERRIQHQDETVNGIRALYICTGKDTRKYILPLEIGASDIKEAEQQSSKVFKHISHLRDTTGGYPLIITEDRWKSQSIMIQKRLLAHLEVFTRIYARNCEVRKIDKNTAAEFLSANHSYSDALCRYRYGLYLKRHTGHNAGTVDISAGTLVAVATFSNARKWIKGEKTIRSYEWTRYASLPDVRVNGGMGKLLRAFIEEVKPDDIMTYADLEWSEGRVYETLGFELEVSKEPVCFMVDTLWRRSPVKPGMTETVRSGSDVTSGSSGNLFFRNFGSNKYRLKLTEYQ